jgi:hypothetical protein
MAGMILNSMLSKLNGKTGVGPVGLAKLTTSTITLENLRDYILYLIEAKRIAPFGILYMGTNLSSHDPHVWKSRMWRIIQELIRGNYWFYNKRFDA